MADKWPPRWLTPLTAKEIESGEGEVVIDFVSAFGKITKDSVAGNSGEPMVLRDWQKELIRYLFAHNEQGYLRNRIALVGMPRKSGKSALSSALALYHQHSHHQPRFTLSHRRRSKLELSSVKLRRWLSRTLSL